MNNKYGNIIVIGSFYNHIYICFNNYYKFIIK